MRSFVAAHTYSSNVMTKSKEKQTEEDVGLRSVRSTDVWTSPWQVVSVWSEVHMHLGTYFRYTCGLVSGTCDVHYLDKR